MLGIHRDPCQAFGTLTGWVRKQYNGLGAGTAGCRLAAQFAFTVLKLQRLECLASPDNLASQRLIAKLGAHYEGTLRNRWYEDGVLKDSLLFSLIPSDVGL